MEKLPYYEILYIAHKNSFIRLGPGRQNVKLTKWPGTHFWSQSIKLRIIINLLSLFDRTIQVNQVGDVVHIEGDNYLFDHSASFAFRLRPDQPA